MNIPELNKTYNFFDDGKFSRKHTDAKVIKIITPEEAKNIKFKARMDEDGDLTTFGAPQDSGEYIYEKSLYDIWKENVEDHVQGTNFTVVNGSDTTPGEPWLYARETPVFVGCSIPSYDKDTIWFVKTFCDSWFSMDVTNCWQSGELDINNDYYEPA